MKKRFTLLFLILGAVLFSQVSLIAQQQIKLDLALHHFEQQLEGWDLQAFDITDMVVSDSYASRHNGVTHFYFNQRYSGIPVYNAINGIHLTADGSLGFATNRFIPELMNKVNAISPQITAAAALDVILNDLQVNKERDFTLLSQSDDEYLFAADNLANVDIPVKLVYLPITDSDDVRLCWDVSFDIATASDYWSIRVDAITGEILDRLNWTLYCSFDHDHGSHSADVCSYEKLNAPASTPMKAESIVVTDNAQYRVFPIPVESPIHGDRELVVNPANVIASPYGWHDTDGAEGADYTITRGNNVHAYLDDTNSNSSAGDEPDGGADLIFDYYFDLNDEPENMQEAAVTQLFYMNNMIHDVLYQYGFDEAGGNFQRRNYTGEGQGFDHVLGEAQDGSGTNNANFSTPPDGGNGRMQMYIWTGAGGRLLNVLEPEQIAGGYETGVAAYGPPVSTDPIEALIVPAIDASSNPSLCCNEIINTEEIAGKIALIDRGECFFVDKTANAEAAGAVAVIICNYEENALGLGGSTNPGIPTISLKASDCATIRNMINQDVPVLGRIVVPDDSGPSTVDADFDNGIIAHEFGHGVSNRLTGGPTAAGCLGNDEQMGEGWSDYFALMFQARPTDTGEMLKGIGNYAVRNDVTGGGIRRLPYSTDPNINDQVFDDIIGTDAPHPLGEIWVGCTWDLYWALVDIYGYDEDIFNGTGGNNIAIQLVIDGMKLQACSPGFEDARDGILAADFINNDGANQCLIWEIFAKRGLGVGANQGSSQNRNDGTQNFDPLPECVKELKIAKSTNSNLIIAGEIVTIHLEVTNHKDEATTGVIVHDELPTGMSYVNGSATGATVTDNGNSLTFDIGTLAAGDDVDIYYDVATDDNMKSLSLYLDDMEDSDDDWIFDAPEGFDIWELSNDLPYSGETSWFVPNTPDNNDQTLWNANPLTVTGTNPTLRFYHYYDTQAGVDGGIIEISTDGFVWEKVDDKFIRNGYRGQLAYGTFAIPNLFGFWGDSGGYVDSYIDLSSYAGEDILVRFRFGSDDAGNATGWFMDDFEQLDLFSYNGEACVSSNEGDMACDNLDNGGVIVEAGIIKDVDDPLHNPEVLQVYPNPANDFLNIGLKGEFSGDVQIQLLNTNGVLVKELNSSANHIIPVNLAGLPAGFYVVMVNTEKGIFVEKVTIQ